MLSNPLVCVQSDEVLSNDNWASVVVLGQYEELPDSPEYAKERSYALSLLEKRCTWWQTSYVASSVCDRPEAPSPVFYCIHIDDISGLRACPEGAPVRVRRSLLVC